MGLSLTKAGVLSGTPTTAGQFLVTLKVTDALNRVAFISTTVRVSLARPPAIFTSTSNIKIPRAGHTATLLHSGLVLVTGGGNGGPDKTAELYDPVSRNATPTGDMTEARSGHTATLLDNSTLPNYGKVLIVGSVDTTAELYNPATNTFAATGRMHHPRASPTATLLLKTGKVLIVGGNTTPGDLKAELYDPASGTFSDTVGSNTVLRRGHTATLLSDGRVLIAGGSGAAASTAELYNPTYGTFTPTAGRMTEPRSGHTATLLGAEDGTQDGSVLIIGTDGSDELYNPHTETFAKIGSLLSAMRPSYRHTASLRNDGTVLVAGGYDFSGLACGSPARVAESGAALFAPESDGFTLTGSLRTPRERHTATVLPDGTILVIGGMQYNGVTTNPFPPFCVVNTVILSSIESFKLNTYTLTGYCFGPVPNTYQMCAVILDTAQCPVGQLAVTPTNEFCSRFAIQPVDASRTCRVGNPFRPTVIGYCETNHF
jgi:hypothetical protein